MRTRLGTAGVAICAALAPAWLGAELPAAMTREVVADFGIDLVAAFELLPNGYMVAGLRGGGIYSFRPEDGLPGHYFAELPVDFAHEGGIIGAEVDPDFAENQTIYFTYTEKRNNRRWITVCSFQVDTDDPTRAVDGSYQVVYDLIDENASGVHFGGGLLFLPDKTLLLGLGDDAVPANGQSLVSRRGKILRLNRDGSVPADNPLFQGERSHLYAMGLRNPFRLYWDPVHQQPLVSDVGAVTWEEINVVYPGANYGWPLVEGPIRYSPGVTPPHGYVDPAFSFYHGPDSSGDSSLRASSLTDGIYYGGDNYPAEVRGNLIVLDWAYSYTRFFVVEQDDSGLVTRAWRWFDDTEGAATDIVVHNDELYVAMAKYGGHGQPYSDSNIVRYRWSELDTPALAISADPEVGMVPLDVALTATLDGEMSPDGSVVWTLPDATEVGGYTTSYVFEDPGVYTLTATGTLPDMAQAHASVTIRAKGEFPINLDVAVEDVSSGTSIPAVGEWALARMDRHIVAEGSYTTGRMIYPHPTIITDGGALLLLLRTQDSAALEIPVPFDGTGYVYTTLEDAVVLSRSAIVGTVRDTANQLRPGVPIRVSSTVAPAELEPLDAVAVSDATGRFYVPIPITYAASGIRATLFPEGDAVYTTVSRDFTVPLMPALQWDAKVGYRDGGAACNLPTVDAPPDMTWAHVAPILADACTGCHGAIKPAVDLVISREFAYTQLLNRPSTQVPGKLLIDGTDGAASYLLEKMNCLEPQVGRPMPVSGLLDEESRRTVVNWILGAQAPEPEPALHLHATVTEGQSPLLVRFLAGASFPTVDSDFRWDMGYGFSTAGINPSHVFTADTEAREFEVGVSVEAPSGETLRQSVLISVSPRPDLSDKASPTARLAAPTRAVMAGTEVSFDASGSTTPNGEMLAYYWTFTGGVISDQMTTTGVTSYSFPNAGYYVIRLAVLDAVGAHDTVEVPIVVQDGVVPRDPKEAMLLVY